MELSQLIKQLLNSGVIENQELAVSLLSSEEVSEEEKAKYIDTFIQNYLQGKEDFFEEDHKHLFEKWVELYLSTQKNSNENNITWMIRKNKR